MGFFDDINKKTNEMMEVSRINTAISDSRKKIAALYNSLGETYYAEKGGTPDAALADLCAQIAAEMSKIEENQARINQLKNIQVCPQCGNQSSRNLRFCGKCGYNFPATETPAAEEETAMKFCGNCGAKIPSSTAFCPQCGTKQQ